MKTVIKGNNAYLVDEQIVKATPLYDFVDKLSIEVAPSIKISPALPKGTLIYKRTVSDRNRQQETILIELTPRVWQMQFTEHYRFNPKTDKWDCIEEQQTQIFQVAAPYLYFLFSFTAGVFNVDEVRVYARTERAKSLDDKLFKTLWPNTNGTRMCFGRTVIPIDKRWPLLMRVNEAIHAIMDSEFNNHNLDWCPIPDDIKTVHEWQTRTIADPNFILSCQLKPTGQSILQAFEGC